jgi:pimeloyl-ACP methyl ester carboxylesterase
VISRRFVDTALGQVHCVVSGSGDATPVVLLHQTPRSVDEFAEVMPILAASRPVIAVDNPGYGCSDKPAEQPMVAEYTAVVLAVMDDLGISAAHLVGHHTGAVLAIESAAAFPDRVGKIVLSGPVYLDEEMRGVLAAAFAQWTIQSDGSHFSEKWGKFADWTDDPRLVHRVVVDLVRAGETSEYGHFSIADYRMEDRLPLVTCPALLIYGARDPFRFDDKNENFGRILPDCRTVTLDGGVFMPNEAPEDFARAILDFL